MKTYISRNKNARSSCRKRKQQDLQFRPYTFAKRVQFMRFFFSICKCNDESALSFFYPLMSRFWPEPSFELNRKDNCNSLKKMYSSKRWSWCMIFKTNYYFLIDCLCELIYNCRICDTWKNIEPWSVRIHWKFNCGFVPRSFK